MRYAATLLTSFFLFWNGVALGQSPDSDYRELHQPPPRCCSLVLRGEVGLGLWSQGYHLDPERYPGHELEAGLPIHSNLAVGIKLSERLTLGAYAFGRFSFDDLPPEEGSRNAWTATYGAGPFIGLHFSDGYHIDLALLVANWQNKTDNYAGTYTVREIGHWSEGGVGAKVGFGKDWALSQNWSIGASAHAMFLYIWRVGRFYDRVHENSISATESADLPFTLGLSLSAAYTALSF